MKGIVADVLVAIVMMSLILVAAASQTPPPISELTQLRVDNAYKKVLMAQQALNAAITSFNEAIQKGMIDEKVPAGKVLKYDPASEKVIVEDAPTPGAPKK